jgi:hypothetical protein
MRNAARGAFDPVSPQSEKMAHYEGRDAVGPTPQDAEALIRSLVGVAGVRIGAAANGTLCEIVVVPDAASDGRQVIRNVTSALMARFGIDLHPDAITIAGPAADTPTQNGHARPAPHAAGRQVVDPGASVAVQKTAPPVRPADRAWPVRNGNGANGAASHKKNGTSHVETARADVPDGPAAAELAQVLSYVRAHAPIRPRLELADLVRSGSNWRCRVVVATGTERFVGVGDGEDGRIADIELAGRVAVDALRAARTPREPIQFEGAVLVDIAGRAHVAVSLSVWNGTDFDTIAGAAPVHGSPAESAAQAVIDSVAARLIA